MINFSAIPCGEQQVIFDEILMMPTLQTELDFYIAASPITETIVSTSMHYFTQAYLSRHPVSQQVSAV